MARDITIITLYDDKLACTYVAAVDGLLSPEQKAGIARGLDAVVDGEDGSHEEDERTVGFRVTTLVEQAGGATPDLTLHNVWAQPD
jgi:hypothetical protein